MNKCDKRMKSIFRLFAICCLLVAVCSCQKDDNMVHETVQNTEIGVLGDQIIFKLNVVLPDPVVVSTRSLDADGERMSLMTLFCFDENGIFVKNVNATIVSNAEDNNKGTLTASIPNSTRIIHFVANLNTSRFSHEEFSLKSEEEALSILEGDLGMMIYWARVQVPENVESLYTNVQGAETRTTSEAILDWITIETNPVGEFHKGVAGQNHPIVLLRNQAKVTVVSEGASDEKEWEGSSFKVTGFTVFNSSLQGTIAPYHHENGFPTYQNENFGVDQWRTTSYINLPKNKSLLNDLLDVTTAEEVFIYESANISSAPVEAIIRGCNIVDGKEQEELYYKVDFVDNNLERLLVRRNHHYKVNIVGNLDYGVKSFKEALTANATNNIFLSISDEVNYLVSSEFKLSVDQTRVIFSNDQIVENNQVELGFHVEALSTTPINPEKLTISWLEADQCVSTTYSNDLVIGKNVVMDANGRGTIRLTLNTLQSGESYLAGTLTVKYGFLMRKIRVLVVNKFDFKPTWITSGVEGVANSDVLLMYTIPADIPAELFPLDVLFTAKDLDFKTLESKKIPIVRRGDADYGEEFSYEQEVSGKKYVITDLGYKYKVTITEPGINRMYLKTLRNFDVDEFEFLVLESPYFNRETKMVTFTENEKRISLNNVMSYTGDNGVLVLYRLVPQKRYAPVELDLSLIGENEENLMPYLNETTEFLLYSTNLDHYQDGDFRVDNADFDCNFIKYSEIGWGTSGRVFAFYPRSEKLSNLRTGNSFEIYMETNKPKCDEVVRIASNVKSYPSIFDNTVPYNDNEYHSITFELATYRPFEFAAQLRNGDVSDVDSELQIEYGNGQEVNISFDVTSFMALDNSSVDPFGTGFEIFIDAPMLELAANPAIEGAMVEMFEKNADGSLPTTITKKPKLENLGNGRFVYRVDSDRATEAAFWGDEMAQIKDNATTSDQKGERKTIKFKTNAIVNNGKVVVSSNPDHIIFNSKTFDITNLPISGEIVYLDENGVEQKLAKGHFVAFAQKYTNNRIGFFTIVDLGKFELRLRTGYTYSWENDAVIVDAQVDGGYYSVEIADLKSLKSNPKIVLKKVVQ